jgi:hypothetical protein
MRHQAQYKNTLIAVFTSHEDAEKAVRKLANDGFDTRRFSIVGLGHLAGMVMAVVDGSVLLGSLNALYAALFSIGIPKDRVIEYEQVLKTGEFLVVSHVLSFEMARSKTVLETSNPTRIDLYENVKTQVSNDMQSVAKMDDARAI